MIDESTKITALTNVAGTTKKAIKISTVEVVIWTLPKMGGPTSWLKNVSFEATTGKWESFRQKTNSFCNHHHHFFDCCGKWNLFRATPPFYDFCAKTCKQFFASILYFEKKMLQFQNSNHDDFIISSWYIAFNFVAAAVYIYGIVFSNINSLTMRLLHQYCCPLMHFF